MPLKAVAILNPSNTSAFAGSFESPISFGPDLPLATREFVGRCDETDRAVQASIVVVADEIADQAASLFERLGCLRSNRRRLERLMPALDLAVALSAHEPGNLEAAR